MRLKKLIWPSFGLLLFPLSLALPLDSPPASRFADEIVFESQFLNVSEELKISGERYRNYDVIVHEVKKGLDPIFFQL